VAPGNDSFVDRSKTVPLMLLSCPNAAVPAIASKSNRMLFKWLIACFSDKDFFITISFVIIKITK
jgi:hypothetical protein